uniref:Uncharacterized protein n=1 Tax=Globisporangium ultimum (strain ATCC 200006 / CBS 805.95 / DAOM BR144) TaxID=431595 RepID=K3X4I0_GLOUD
MDISDDDGKPAQRASPKASDDPPAKKSADACAFCDMVRI